MKSFNFVTLLFWNVKHLLATHCSLSIAECVVAENVYPPSLYIYLRSPKVVPSSNFSFGTPPHPPAVNSSSFFGGGVGGGRGGMDICWHCITFGEKHGKSDYSICIRILADIHWYLGSAIEGEGCMVLHYCWVILIVNRMYLFWWIIIIIIMSYFVHSVHLS